MSEADTLAVHEAVREFIEAFDNLDWERFRQCFAPDATVFFPFDIYPRRANGKEDVEAGFKRFFDEVRTQAAGPPYLHFVPKDITVQIWHDIALVTYHLDRPEGVGRRTSLWQKQAHRWRIVHLHASTITPSRPH